MIEAVVLTAAAGKLTENVLAAMARPLKRSFSEGDRKLAFRRSVHEALAIMAARLVPDDEAEAAHFADVLQRFAGSEDVGDVLAARLQGLPLDRDALFEAFRAAYDTETLPDVDYREGFTYFEAALITSAAADTNLQPIILAGNADAQTRLIRDLLAVGSETRDALLQLLELVGSAPSDGLSVIGPGKLYRKAADLEHFSRTGSGVVDVQAVDGGIVVIVRQADATARRGMSDEDTARRGYLAALRQACLVLPLGTLGGDESAGEEVTLDQVYIDLDTTSPAQQEGPKDEEVRLRGGRERPLKAMAAASRHDRLVLLGDPGSGKSAFVSNLAALQARVLLDGGEPIPGIDPDLLPVVLRLRDLVTPLAELTDAPPTRGRSEADLQRRLVDLCCETIQASVRGDFGGPIADAFGPVLEREARAGRMLLVLDGLDEVPVDLRDTVRRAVYAMLARTHPRRVIVTCRIRSYVDAAKLPAFAEYTLAPLDEEKIGEFCRLWYRALQRRGRVTADRAVDRSADLAREALNPQLRELAENPMLLTTMALVHQRDIEFPKQRAVLYDRAVDVLAERWQKWKTGRLTPSDPLQAVLTEKHRLRPLLEELAYAAHAAAERDPASDRKRAGGLGRGTAIELLERPSMLGETGLAAEFLDYVDQRAGLLVGYGGTGSVTYGFPHRSFQEYLAGCRMIKGRDKVRQFWTHAGAGDYWWLAAQLGAEDFRFVKVDETPLLDLAYGLAGLADLADRAGGASEQAARARLWSGHMAALLGRQVLLADDHPGGGSEFVARLETGFLALLGGSLTPPERADAGRILARLGDPRESLLDPLRMEFCFVPAGPFFMGSREGEEGAVEAEIVADGDNPYDVGYGYWIGRYPVTNAQFDAFTGEGGYDERRFWEASGADRRDGPFWTVEGVGGGQDRRKGRRRFGSEFDVATAPVVGVSWYEAVAFVAWLGERLPAGWEARLPSEPEWEKAARGGVRAPAAGGQVIATVGELSATPLEAVGLPENPVRRRRYPWGGPEPSGGRANFGGAGIVSPSPVGCFPGGASVYGCEELSGNVWEWTRSLWIEAGASHGYPYPVDPDGRARRERLGEPGPRVLRGGAWLGLPGSLRCACRFGSGPDFHFVYVGFRVVVSPSSLDSDASGL